MTHYNNLPDIIIIIIKVYLNIRLFEQTLCEQNSPAQSSNSADDTQ